MDTKRTTKCHGLKFKKRKLNGEKGYYKGKQALGTDKGKQSRGNKELKTRWETTVD